MFAERRLEHAASSSAAAERRRHPGSLSLAELLESYRSSGTYVRATVLATLLVFFSVDVGRGRAGEESPLDLADDGYWVAAARCIGISLSEYNAIKTATSASIFASDNCMQSLVSRSRSIVLGDWLTLALEEKNAVTMGIYYYLHDCVNVSMTERMELREIVGKLNADRREIRVAFEDDAAFEKIPHHLAVDVPEMEEKKQSRKKSNAASVAASRPNKGKASAANASPPEPLGGELTEEEVMPPRQHTGGAPNPNKTKTAKASDEETTDDETLPADTHSRLQAARSAPVEAAPVAAAAAAPHETIALYSDTDSASEGAPATMTRTGETGADSDSDSDFETPFPTRK